MKKILNVIVMIMILAVNPITIKGNQVDSDYRTEIEYLTNGDKIETVFISENTNNRGLTKKGTKIVEYKNSNGTVLWKATLTATFTYTGSSATCNTSSISAVSYANTWSITNKKATKNGNTAIGKVTAKQYYIGTAIQTVNKNITIKCSASGTLS